MLKDVPIKDRIGFVSYLTLQVNEVIDVRPDVRYHNWRSAKQSVSAKLPLQVAVVTQDTREPRQMLPSDVHLEELDVLLNEADLVLTGRHIRSLLIREEMTYENLASVLAHSSEGDVDTETVARWARAEYLPQRARRMYMSHFFKVERLGPSELEQLAYAEYVRLCPKDQPWITWLPHGNTRKLPELPGQFLDVLASHAFWHVYKTGVKVQDTAGLEEVKHILTGLPVCSEEAALTFVKSEEILDAVENVCKWFLRSSST